MASRQRTCTYKAQRGGCKKTNAFLSKCCVAVCHTPEHLGSPAQRVGDKVLHAHKRCIGGLSVGASGILQEVRDGDKVRVVVEQDAACWIAVTPGTPCVLVVPERVQGGATRVSLPFKQGCAAQHQAHLLFHSFRYTVVNYCPDVRLVNAHSKGHSGHNNASVISQELEADTLCQCQSNRSNCRWSTHTLLWTRARRATGIVPWYASALMPRSRMSLASFSVDFLVKQYLVMMVEVDVILVVSLPCCQPHC